MREAPTCNRRHLLAVGLAAAPFIVRPCGLALASAERCGGQIPCESRIKDRSARDADCAAFAQLPELRWMVHERGDRRHQLARADSHLRFALLPAASE